MTLPQAPIRASLVAALLTGIALWLLLPGRAALWSAGGLPSSRAPAQGAADSFYASVGPSSIPREPLAVGVLSNGDVLVADGGLAQIQRFDSRARLVHVYRGAGTLRYPAGLAVAVDDRVWVADLWARRIARLDLESDTLNEIPSAPSGYRAPGALAYHDGLLYLADLERHQVLVLQPDGALVRVIGSGKGTGTGELSYANGVAVDDLGNVFVADSNNGRIQVFAPEGRVERVLRPHRLVQPRGLALDPRGRLYVADTQAHEVLVLDAAGRLLASQSGDDGLSFPTGLALFAGRLYVADRGNSRVVAWDLADE